MISLIQTAEGALNESHSILQRMRELAVQSSNDTNTESDRAELQKEVDQLSQELSRIGNNTEFNTQNLLDGSFEGTFQIGANEDQNLTIDVKDMRGQELGMAGASEFSETVTASGSTELVDGTYTVDGTDLKDSNGNVIATTTDNLTFTSTGTAAETIVFSQKIEDGKITIQGGEATATAKFDNGGLEAGDYTINYSAGASTITDSNGNLVASSADDTIFKNADGDTVLTLDAAATTDMEISVGGVDISSQSAANSAITKINDAIETVSAERSKLGAYQNRLDHTINNLGTSAENLTAAESRIRDVDYDLAAA
ncbi:flagellin [Virgibacillus kekensis]|uniref:Flagellin n=1 Tax=Virgibacillus kekensis TaxID=202261 RepID=A0ABV9DIA7_9BACI